MGVYTRYKKAPDGLRQLVEMLETTPASRRLKMVDIGFQEDREFTEKAMALIFTWEDILALPENELAEVLGLAPARIVAYAFHGASDDLRARMLRTARGQAAMEIRNNMDLPVGPRETLGAQLKVIEAARKLERRGVVKTKRIAA